jgi:hypothetical protein
MRGWSRQAISIADVEILIEVDREELLGEFRAPLTSYLSAGSSPVVTLRYRAQESSPRKSEASSDHPGFSMRSASSSAYRFERGDTRGDVLLPAAAGPVLAEFEGAPARYSLEAALRVTLSLALPRIGAVFLHSSGVYFDGQAVFFSGPSGAGKSTIAGLLSESPAFGGRLGDDLNVARPREGDSHAWIAHSTPFAGDLAMVPRSHAPLAGIHFLRQSTTNRAVRLDESRALPRVLRNMLAYVDEREAADRALGIASRIVRDVPCYELEFAREPSVALEILGKMRRASHERRPLEA